MSNVFEINHVIVKHYLSILRDVNTDISCFRQALDKLGLFLAMDLTGGLVTETVPIDTPLMPTEGAVISEQVAVVPILRAGLALVQPFRELLPEVHIFHLGMYRDEQTATPVPYYNKLQESPSVDSAIVVDPMLATGGSAIAAISALRKRGIEKISFGCVIAAPEGIVNLQEAFPDVPVTACSIDDGLNDINYILPGLGDAGDRYFGTV
ncbi:MAG: uracil phosphoribosyltransferase [Planctomycetaceae bacterium]|nr:uracil phosphoribosyltransferase [Planctomycetaceae bacterium]